MLWMNWRPPARPDMAFSVEDDTYIALYGGWADPSQDEANAAWSAQRMADMSAYSSGIQLADENLGRRPAPFVPSMDGTAMSRAAVLRALRRPGGRHGDGVRSLGWTPEELAEYRYAQHWNPQMAPLAPHVLQALGHSPVAEELLAPMAREVRDIEGSATRHGYAVTSAGAIHVHLATPMPGVTPAMIDWWFGWHSDSPERYRLWHPRAHVDARWESEPPAATEGRARILE